LSGGAEIDVGHLPPPDASRDEATKTKIANKLASELKNAAHYFAYRAPATSLGYRTIADELYKQVPTLSGKPPRKLDEGHEGQTKKQMGRVIWGDQIPNRPKGKKTEFFSDVYKREVEPHFASLKAKNPSMTHNEVQRYLEENV
jgi:CRISPR/Cas system CMR subunit Cmr6 (Cas7 group RAMP superfamily)